MVCQSPRNHVSWLISSNTVRIISTLLHDDEITKFKVWALQWWYSARGCNSLIRALTPHNEIIDIAGEEVLEVILSKARSAKWFSIMADECTDVANLEQMAVYYDYVDNIENNFLIFLNIILVGL
jgi:hypothetical protein